MGGFQSIEDFDKFVGGAVKKTTPAPSLSPTPEPDSGLISAGNIDLYNRPKVKNKDGTVSTVRSISANIDGREILMPTVSDDGRIMSNKEAIDQYKKSGKHLGIFRDTKSANSYAEKLHKDYASGTYDKKKGFGSIQDLDKFVSEPHTGAYDRGSTPVGLTDVLFGKKPGHAPSDETTIGSYEPGMIDRFKTSIMSMPVAGDLTLGKLFERLDESPLGGIKAKPELQQFQKRGLTVATTIEAFQGGIGDAVQGLTTPKNVAIMGAMIAAAPSRVMRALIDAGFAADMARGAVEGFRAGYAAWESGDHVTALRYWTSAPVNAVMAVLAGTHLGYEGYHGIKGRMDFNRAKTRLDDHSKTKFEKPFEDLSREEKAEVVYDLTRAQHVPQTIDAAKKLGLQHPEADESLLKKVAGDQLQRIGSLNEARKIDLAEALEESKIKEPEKTQRENAFEPPPVLEAPILDSKERMFRRQDELEAEARTILNREREDRQRKYQEMYKSYRKHEQDRLDVTARMLDIRAEEIEKEKAKEPRERRRLVPAYKAAEENFSKYRRMTEEMTNLAKGVIDSRKIAGAGKFEPGAIESDPVSIVLGELTALRGEPGAMLRPEEQDFLRMHEERNRLLRQSDWKSLLPEKNSSLQPTPDEEEFNRVKEDIRSAEREAGLREAAQQLRQQAQNAKTPEESEKLSDEATEAQHYADELQSDRQQSEAQALAASAQKEERDVFPMDAPVKSIKGKGNTIILPDRRRIPFHYALVSIKDLVVSHDPVQSFEVNEDYPQQLQPRDYKNNKELQVGVIAGGNSPEPAFVFSDSVSGIEGPPVVREDGVVAGGNGRTMRFKLAYAQGLGETIRNALVEKAGVFGFSPEQIPDLNEQPMLVRVLDSPVTKYEDLIRLGQDLNRDEGMGMSVAESAVAMAQRMGPEMLDWIANGIDQMGEDATVRDFLRYRGTEALNKMVSAQMIPPNKVSEYMSSDGEITEKGKMLFIDAMRGKVIDDADLLATTPESILKKIDRSLALLFQLKGAGAWDVSDYLKESLRIWKRVDSVKDSLDKIGKPDDSLIDKWIHPDKYPMGSRLMEFGAGETVREIPHPITEALAKTLESNGIEVKRILKGYVADAEGTQITIGEPPTPRESFNRNIAERVGVEVQDGDWGTLKARPAPPVEKPRQDAQKPPVEALPPTPEQPRSLDAVPERPVKQEAPSKVTEQLIRERLGSLPGWSVGKINAGLEVMKRFATMYLGVPFDEYLSDTFADVRVIPEESFKEREDTLLQDMPNDVGEKIKDGGGEPLGLQPEYKQDGYPDVPAIAYFNISIDGNTYTLGLRVEEVTPETVKARIDDLNQTVKNLKVKTKTAGPQTLYQKKWGEGMSDEELQRFVKEAGRNLRSEPYGEQADLFAGPEQMYRVYNKVTKESVLVSEGKMIELKKLNRNLDNPQSNLFTGTGQGLLFQGKKGATEFNFDDGRAVVSLFEQADISTLLHESFHVFRRQLKPDDLGTLEKWLKINDGAWTKTAEETAARAWERYFYEGKSPTPELRSLFAKIKAWMFEVYRALKGSAINVKIPDQVRQVFDRMLAGEKMERPAEKMDSLPEPVTEKATESPKTLDLTPEQMESATLVAEAGEDMTAAQGKSRQKMFATQDEAFAWAVNNKDKLRAVRVFTLPEGNSFAQFIPRDESVLFQEQSPQDLDREIRFISQRLNSILPQDERVRLAKRLQELEQKKKAFNAPVQEAGLNQTPEQPKVIKLWTPEGEATSGKKTDTQRRTLDATPELRDAGGTGSVSGDTGKPRQTPRDEGAGRTVRAGDESGSGRPASERPKRALPTIPDARLDAPVHDRGAPTYAPEAWAKKLKDFRLPENTPAPFVSLPQDIRRMLIFPGQPEVAEVALSGLKQHDAFIIATSTGTGKTYLGSAILSQMVKPDSKVLVLTTNQSLIHANNGWIAVARDFDVDVQPLPSGVSDPGEPGVYIATYAAAIGRDGLQNVNWDFVLSDEIGVARRWYASQTGAMMKELGTNAKKVLYMSATPFHTALEVGHMDKLGLWRQQGFDAWGKQFGIYRDTDGNWAGGNAPKKLVKLREQLIERGQMINQDRIMDGYSSNFAVVPMDEQTKQGVRDIDRAFKLAEDYFRSRKKMSMLRAVKGNAVTFMKNYLERQRLPQAVEIAKKLEKEGWKVIIFSEHKAEVSEIFNFLKEADEGLGGEISRLMPKLPGVPETLDAAFEGNISNFSGKHSPIREGEKEAFLSNAKKHIYATYGAGGIGVSLHDTSRGGMHPRAAIYLGPPWSGVMFDQAIGRPWRYGTNSNVHAIFLVSDAKPEMRLVLEKVAPRLESLRAVVSGIDKGDPLVESMRKLDSSKDAALAYELGQEQSNTSDDFMVTESTNAIVNWRNVPIETAENAKGKGMRFPGLEVQAHPGVVRLFQEEEEPPADFLLPRDMELRAENEELKTRLMEGDHVPGGNPMQHISAPARAILGEAISVMAMKDAETSDNPVAELRSRWEHSMNHLGALAETIEGTRAAKAAKIQDMYWLTNGRKVIRDVSNQAGNGAAGKRISRKIAEYHVEWENTAGPWVSRYYQILRDHKITKEEHHNMVMVKQGLKPPINDRVAKASEQLTKLFNDVRASLAKDGVTVNIYDRLSGGTRRVAYSEILDDPKYWPRKYDPNMKIDLRDPETGKQFSIKLKEFLDLNTEVGKTESQKKTVEEQRVKQGVSGDLKELFDQDPAAHKRETIIRSMMHRYGISRTQIEDFLEARHRDVPLVGNVERAREFDIPFYRTDPDAGIGYLEGAAEASSRTRIFGQDREKLDPIISEIPNAKARAVVKEIMESLLSRRPFEEETKDLVSLAADWSVLSKMTFSAIKVLGHPVHAALFTNTTTLLRAIAETATNWKEMRENALFNGSILEQTRTEMLREFGLRRRAATRALDILGYQGGYTFGRVVTDRAGALWLEKKALPKLLKDPQHDFRRQIKEVFLLNDDQIDKAIQNKHWSPDDVRKASAALSDRVMFTFDPTELPPTWRSRSDQPVKDNVMATIRVATLLKSYMFKTSALLRERLWDEAKQGNFRPWLPFIVLYPAVGEMIADATALFTANPKRFKIFIDKNEQTIGKWLWRIAGDIGHATGLTFLEMVVENMFEGKVRDMTGDAFEFLAGPAVSDIMRTVLKLPTDFFSAKDSRSSSAGEKRYQAIIKWLRATFPAARLVTPGPPEKKGGGRKGSGDYHFTPMPTQ